MELKIKLKL